MLGDSTCYEERWDEFIQELRNGSEDQRQGALDIDKLMFVLSRNLGKTSFFCRFLQNHQLRSEKEVMEKRRRMRENIAVVEVEEDPEEVGTEVFDRAIDEEAHGVNKTRLNAKQQEIFNRIISTVENQVSFTFFSPETQSFDRKREQSRWSVS